VGGAKIMFNLVRRSNRDDHVMRTFEIPACGGFMLADRTEGQRAFLAEDREAVYFSTIDEMIEKIRYHLPRDAERRRIAEAGHRRITSGQNTYADRLKSIIEMVRGASPAQELRTG
jgi:spore maturation protein CgeB